MSFPPNPKTTNIVLTIVGTTLMSCIIGTFVQPAASTWSIPLATACLAALLTALTPSPNHTQPSKNGPQ